jgi:biotin transport system substrate-specific component
MQHIGFKQESIQALTGPRIAWKTVGGIVLATAVVAICAHISVPLGFTPVPMTMQSFAVILLGLMFGPGPAFACLALYLMEGAMGLPVFSPQGPGGMAQLLGPTGGYLLSYPFAAALASLLYRRSGRNFWAALGGGAASSLLILACGFTWLALMTHLQPGMIFAQSVAPFLPGDVVKLLAAALCAGALGSFRENSRNRTL